MRILSEGQISGNLSVLNQTWDEAETFALVPDRGGVTREWIAERISTIPSKYQLNHFVLQSSGSTGVPKLIVGNRGRAEMLAGLLHRIQNSEPVRQAILVLPLTYCYAFVNQWLWSRVFNRDLIQTRGFRSPDELRTILDEARDSMICLVGAQLPLFRKHLPDRSFKGISRVHFAGGRFPQDDLDFVRNLFPNASIFNNYGCAEAMPRLTIRRAEDSDNGANIGKPIDGVALKTSDEGMLLFKSPYRMVAQIDSEGFKEVTDDAWIPTGDMGTEGENGYWYLQGRANEVYKRFGEKISLAQLASSLKEVWHGEAAFYRQKDRSGEDGHVLVLSPGPSEEEVRTVLRMLRQSYARAYWPLRIESVHSLPLLANQKVDMLALASMDNKNTHWDQRV
ncbi:MAG: AMP-binding protein [Syntrophobacteraceae bacterium]